MIRHVIVLFVAAILGLSFAPAAHAQPACGGEGQAGCGIFRTDCQPNLKIEGGRCVHPACGRDGERACEVFVRIPSCDVGLVEAPGAVCRVRGQCGAAGQRVCLVFDGKPACDAGLIVNNGTCVRPNCGGQDQRACTVDVRVPSCDADLVEFEGFCRARGACGGEGQRRCLAGEPGSWNPVTGCASNLVVQNNVCTRPNCGALDQRACTVGERIPSCDAGLVEFEGFCRARGACGGLDQRPCTVIERIPSCDAGLVEAKGACIRTSQKPPTPTPPTPTPPTPTPPTPTPTPPAPTPATPLALLPDVQSVAGPEVVVAPLSMATTSAPCGGKKVAIGVGFRARAWNKAADDLVRRGIEIKAAYPESGDGIIAVRNGNVLERIVIQAIAQCVDARDYIRRVYVRLGGLALCNAGEVVIGGGFQTSVDGHLVASRPEKGGWGMTAVLTSPLPGRPLTSAVAMCAPAEAVPGWNLSPSAPSQFAAQSQGDVVVGCGSGAPLAVGVDGTGGSVPLAIIVANLQPNGSGGHSSEIWNRDLFGGPGSVSVQLVAVCRGPG